MGNSYFQELNKLTDTRFWINNPTIDEAKKAMENHAINCTTNPAYCSGLLTKEKDFITQLIDTVILKTNDNDQAAMMVYETATGRLMDAFLPIYEKSCGKEGFVTLQDDPRFDEDINHIVECCKKNRIRWRNYMAKIPVIESGIQAIDFCVSQNIPICATEVFSISQALLVCEKYETACNKYGNRPIMFVTHISGIFDEYLNKTAQRLKFIIEPETIDKAGLAIARKEYRLLKERGYDVKILGGGARAIHHFTGLVGGNAHITINWSTAEEIINKNIAVESCIEDQIDEKAILQLSEKFPDFKKAYEDDGLRPEEFASFGPVQLFRNAFIKGWFLLLAEIVSRRHANAV